MSAGSSISTTSPGGPTSMLRSVQLVFARLPGPSLRRSMRTHTLASAFCSCRTDPVASGGPKLQSGSEPLPIPALDIGAAAARSGGGSKPAGTLHSPPTPPALEQALAAQLNRSANPGGLPSSPHVVRQPLVPATLDMAMHIVMHAQ